MQKPPVISDYDSVSYDYENYWNGREYEDASDKLALIKLLEDQKAYLTKNDTYIDIGGSYGREVKTYLPYFNHVILFDYSRKSLEKGKRYLDELGITNISYIAGNIYFLPFNDSSIESGGMVRVMHHIKSPSLAINEIDRVIRKSFILEVANKLHAKYVIKQLFTLHFKNLFDNAPIQQEFRNTSQGSSGKNQIFLNFPSSLIKGVINRTSFKIINTLSVSNFRIGILKKIFPNNFLLMLEDLLQRPLSLVNFGPSIYYLLKKKSFALRSSNFDLEKILCCPKCKGKLEKLENGFSCNKDNLTFILVNGVYDFRYVEDL